MEKHIVEWQNSGKKECERERDTVPFYTKEDEIDLTHKKIQEQIEKKICKNQL